MAKALTLDEILIEAGRAVESRMKSKHLSQDNVADEVRRLGGDISQKTISNILKNRTQPEFKNIYWLAAGVGMSLAEVFEFTHADEDAKAHSYLTTILRSGGEARESTIHILKMLAKRVG